MKRCYYFAIFFALMGALFASISLYEHILLSEQLSDGPSFCNINSRINCDLVNTSKYAVLMGIPLASYGLAFYSAIAGFLAFAVFRSVARSNIVADILMFFGLFSTVFSFYLFYISHFVIGALCLLCLGMYGVNISLFAVGYYCNRKQAFFYRIRQAIEALLSFLVSAFSVRKTPGNLLARVGLIFLVANIVLVYFIPAIAVPVFEYFKPVQHSSAFQNWLGQPHKEISLDPSCVPGGDYYKGSLEAPVVIVEFADMKCPFCRYFYGMIESFIRKHPNKVLFVYKHYPIDSDCNPGVSPGEGHRYSCFAAEFSLCAGEQGRFWEAVDHLFETEDMAIHHPTVTAKEEVELCMERLSLDPIVMRECLSSKRTFSQIRADIEQGDRLGLQWTPYVFVNGRLLENPDEQVIEEIISYVTSSDY